MPRSEVDKKISRPFVETQDGIIEFRRIGRSYCSVICIRKASLTEKASVVKEDSI